MKNKKINFACFKDAITAPGIFGSELTLSDTKQFGIQMELEPGLLVVHYKGREVLIPLNNIKSMVVEEDVQAAVQQSKKATSN